MATRDCAELEDLRSFMDYVRKLLNVVGPKESPMRALDRLWQRARDMEARCSILEDRCASVDERSVHREIVILSARRAVNDWLTHGQDMWHRGGLGELEEAIRNLDNPCWCRVEIMRKSSDVGSKEST